MAQENTEAARPLTDFVIELFGLDPSSLTAGLVGRIIEPTLQIALILAVAGLAIGVLRGFLRRTIRRLKERPGAGLLGEPVEIISTRRAQRLEAVAAVLRSAIAVVVWTVAVFTILGTTFGVNIGPLLAGAGIAGVAIGFGAQDLVKDVISGLFMLAEDQYGVGDIVNVGEATGVVEGLGLRTTRIRDINGTLWHVPNGEIRRVGNMSQQWARAVLDIGVAYGTDLDRAAAVIKEVADQMAGEEGYRSVFLEEPEILGVEALGADSVVIRLAAKTSPGQQWAVSRELRRRIKIALDSAGIEIPFPQRTLWIKQDGPVPAPVPKDPAAPSAAAGKATAEETGDKAGRD